MSSIAPATQQPAAPTTEPSAPSGRTGPRLLATSVALVALAVVQAPGRLVADTKIDLVVAPLRMLERALTLWDPLGAFGQVGNQAYGYLWPMGPFFVVGHWASVPMWLVQRLWMATVLVVAFQGAARLARALGVRHDVALVLTGLAYALSPRLLTTVGPISIEAWPSALAPWVLLALVLGSRQGSPVRHALGAALGVAMVGGVNAAATFAVIPLGAVWLLTRSPGARKRQLLVWWPIFTVLACLWWLVPLVLLGRYSPPFLDYIETADVTTYPTTLFNALRGTSAWIPYVESRWQSGNALITDPVMILDGTVVMVLGLAGIARRDNPHRAFLSLSLLTGLLMVTAGHAGAGQGWFADSVRDLLDAGLAPLRNVHKFDPVIRVPMVLGLGHLLDVWIRRWREAPHGAHERRRLLRRVRQLDVVWIAAVALVGASIPALTGRLTPTGDFYEIPDYVKQAAAWVGSEDPRGRSLLLPSSQFGSYVWGRPQDEPFEPLAAAPWAVRNAIPLAPPGNIRVLDGLEEEIGRGAGSAALAPYLRRLGVRFLVVRNDLSPGPDVADPALVHQALATSPGIRPVRGFGPAVGGLPSVRKGDGKLSIDHGWEAKRPAIEVYEVAEGPGLASVTSDPPVVVGAPEDLLPLTEQRLLVDQPTVMGYDADPSTAPSGPVILTDGLRLRDRFFGQEHGGASPTLTAAEARRLGSSRTDFEVAGERWKTAAVLEGIAGVTASSSSADPRSPGGSQPGTLPFAALDHDDTTAWVSRPDTAERAYLRVDLGHEAQPRHVVVTTGDLPAGTARIRVRTAAGIGRAVSVPAGQSARIALPPGETTFVQVEDASRLPGRRLSVATLDIPGVSALRWLSLPALPQAWGAPAYVVLDARTDPSTGCVQVGISVRCGPAPTGTDEEPAVMRRIVTVPAAAQYRLRLQVRPRSGGGVPDLLQRRQPLNVHASSTSNPAAEASGLAAVDGDPGTTWVSDPTDRSPSLDLQWLGRRRVASIHLALDPDAPARRPTRVVVSYPGGRQRLSLTRDGWSSMRPVRVSNLSIRVTRSTPTFDVTPDGTAQRVGAGISEVSLGDVPYLPLHLSSESEDFGCGSGPPLQTGFERPVRTAVVASPHDIYRARLVDLRVCGSHTITLSPGENRLSLGSTPAFMPASMVLRRTDAPPAPPALDEAVPSSDSGRYTVPPGKGLLVVRQNANPGWTAHLGGHSLGTATADGWQQAYRLQGAGGTVVATYAPNAPYRWGLAVGGAMLAALCLLLQAWRVRPPAWWPPPPVGTYRRAGVVAAGGWVLAAGVLAGTIGLITMVGVGAGLGMSRRWTPAGRWAALALLATTGLFYALRPWGSPLGWAGSHAAGQVLVIGALALLPFAELDDVLRRRSRRQGTSTNR